MRLRETVMNLTGILSAVLLFALLPLPATAAEIVCINCHESMPGRLGEPVKLWQDSIHAENGIACNACHGGDPKDAANAMSPARGFLGAPQETSIPAFCGRCHVGVMHDYLASAHGKMLGRGGPTCVTCHSNHQVFKASLDLINEKSCGRCHSFERARLLRAAMQETEGMIVAMDQRLSAYNGKGMDTEGLEKRLFAVRNRFHTLFHNVDVEMVKKESAAIQGDLKKIQDQLTALDQERRKRKLAGAGGISAMLLLALFAHLLRKTYD